MAGNEDQYRTDVGTTYRDPWQQTAVEQLKQQSIPSEHVTPFSTPAVATPPAEKQKTKEDIMREGYFIPQSLGGGYVSPLDLKQGYDPLGMVGEPTTSESLPFKMERQPKISSSDVSEKKLPPELEGKFISNVTVRTTPDEIITEYRTTDGKVVYDSEKAGSGQQFDISKAEQFYNQNGWSLVKTSEGIVAKKMIPYTTTEKGKEMSMTAEQAEKLQKDYEKKQAEFKTEKQNLISKGYAIISPLTAYQLKIIDQKKYNEIKGNPQAYVATTHEQVTDATFKKEAEQYYENLSEKEQLEWNRRALVGRNLDIAWSGISETIYGGKKDWNQITKEVAIDTISKRMQASTLENGEYKVKDIGQVLLAPKIGVVPAVLSETILTQPLLAYAGSYVLGKVGLGAYKVLTEGQGLVQRSLYPIGEAIASNPAISKLIITPASKLASLAIQHPTVTTTGVTGGIELGKGVWAYNEMVKAGYEQKKILAELGKMYTTDAVYIIGASAGLKDALAKTETRKEFLNAIKNNEEEVFHQGKVPVDRLQEYKTYLEQKGAKVGNVNVHGDYATLNWVDKPNTWTYSKDEILNAVKKGSTIFEDEFGREVNYKGLEIYLSKQALPDRQVTELKDIIDVLGFNKKYIGSYNIGGQPFSIYAQKSLSVPVVFKDASMLGGEFKPDILRANAEGASYDPVNDLLFIKDPKNAGYFVLNKKTLTSPEFYRDWGKYLESNVFTKGFWTQDVPNFLRQIGGKGTTAMQSSEAVLASAGKEFAPAMASPEVELQAGRGLSTMVVSDTLKDVVEKVKASIGFTTKSTTAGKTLLLPSPVPSTARYGITKVDSTTFLSPEVKVRIPSIERFLKDVKVPEILGVGGGDGGAGGGGGSGGFAIPSMEEPPAIPLIETVMKNVGTSTENAMASAERLISINTGNVGRILAGGRPLLTSIDLEEVRSEARKKVKPSAISMLGYAPTTRRASPTATLRKTRIVQQPIQITVPSIDTILGQTTLQQPKTTTQTKVQPMLNMNQPKIPNIKIPLIPRLPWVSPYIYWGGGGGDVNTILKSIQNKVAEATALL